MTLSWPRPKKEKHTQTFKANETTYLSTQIHPHIDVGMNVHFTDHMIKIIIIMIKIQENCGLGTPVSDKQDF